MRGARLGGEGRDRQEQKAKDQTFPSQAQAPVARCALAQQTQEQRAVGLGGDHRVGGPYPGRRDRLRTQGAAVGHRLVGNSRLQVQVISQPDFVPLGLVHSGIYLFPQGATTPAAVPADVRSRQRMTDYERWAQQSGGVPAQTLAMRMTVRAAGDTPVVLNGLRVEVVRRSAPLIGWFRVPEGAAVSSRSGPSRSTWTRIRCVPC